MDTECEGGAAAAISPSRHSGGRRRRALHCCPPWDGVDARTIEEDSWGRDGDSFDEVAPGMRCNTLLASCASCFLLLILALEVVLGMLVGPEFVKRHVRWAANITMCERSDVVHYHCGVGRGYLLTPANLTDHILWDSCARDDLKEEMKRYSGNRSWKIVKFESRRGMHGQETLQLAAWWLPVDDPKAPRIVIQHGNNVNANDRTVQSVAYLLRSIGFACLLPNLRDHGLSLPSHHGSVGWGYDYHLDLLGAWDYAVRDPSGFLGGAADASLVGVLGFSMGGFVVSNAFGLEQRVPGAWVDSGVFNPKEELYFIMFSHMGSLAKLFIDSAWFFAERAAGVDLMLHTPGTTLPRSHRPRQRGRFVFSPQRRFVAVAQGLEDDLVPPSQSDRLVELLETYPDWYAVAGKYYMSVSCRGNTHCVMQTMFPAMYRHNLCDFWSGVFQRSPELCGLAGLPKFEEAERQEANFAYEV